MAFIRLLSFKLQTGYPYRLLRGVRKVQVKLATRIQASRWRRQLNHAHVEASHPIFILRCQKTDSASCMGTRSQATGSRDSQKDAFLRLGKTTSVELPWVPNAVRQTSMSALFFTCWSS